MRYYDGPNDVSMSFDMSSLVFPDLFPGARSFLSAGIFDVCSIMFGLVVPINTRLRQNNIVVKMFVTEGPEVGAA